jgi:16S rRNA processing protein RimM
MEIKPHQGNALPQGQYYHDQLIGLPVKTTGGEFIGTISDILTGPANDNLVVRSEKGEILIPIIEDIIRSVEPEAGRVTIEPMQGLLELNEKKPLKN